MQHGERMESIWLGLIGEKAEARTEEAAKNS